MKYTVTIEETLAEEFEVEAASMQDATKIAREEYKSCNFVLEPGNIVDCKLCVSGYGNWETM